MAKRTKNERLIETQELPVTLNVILLEYLNKLVQKGCYGTRLSDAAQKILSDAIEHLVQTEALKRIDFDERHKPEKNNKSED